MMVCIPTCLFSGKSNPPMSYWGLRLHIANFKAFSPNFIAARIPCRKPVTPFSSVYFNRLTAQYEYLTLDQEMSLFQIPSFPNIYLRLPETGWYSGEEDGKLPV